MKTLLIAAVLGASVLSTTTATAQQPQAPAKTQTVKKAEPTKQATAPATKEATAPTTKEAKPAHLKATPEKAHATKAKSEKAEPKAAPAK